MATQNPVVRVGVAAIIHDEHGRLVLGIRRGSHGEGMPTLRPTNLHEVETADSHRPVAIPWWPSGGGRELFCMC